MSRARKRASKKQSGGLIVWLFFAICFYSGAAFSSETKHIVIASSEGPPHTIKGPDNGIDLDITKHILREMGYEVSFSFMSLARAMKEVKEGRVNGITPTFAQRDEANFFVTKPFIDYRPMVFSLKEDNKTPQTLSDLFGESVATFQGAPGYFGAEFVELSQTDNYHEIYNMSLIPEMLARKRVSFAVLDQYIFYYFYRLKDKNRPIKIFAQHELIQPVKASAAFNGRTLRDEFNAQLTKSLNDQVKHKIIQRYLGEFDLD